MNKLFSKMVLGLITISCFSFQLPTPILQEIFQEAFTIQALEKEMAKDEDGNLLPVTLITKGLLSENMELSFDEQAVTLIDQLATPSSNNTNVLELTSITQKGEKAKLTFKFGNKKIKIRLKQIEGEWISRTISIKSKNSIDIHISDNL